LAVSTTVTSDTPTSVPLAEAEIEQIPVGVLEAARKSW
jgi:hypothetical protein